MATMIPRDYRLEHVCARLIERLEGARRSYAGQPAKAAEAFERHSREHVAAAVAEFRELALDDSPELHEQFLLREVVETFLPRYERLAVGQTDAEQGGWGFGPLASPIGRLVLGVVGMLAALFFARFALVFPLAWGLVLFAAAVPFGPAVSARSHRTRYAAELQSLLQDLAKVQEQSRAYARPDQLRTDDPLDQQLADARRRAAAKKDKP